ncbi:MAG: hypothetical protein GX256_04600, partial [Fretibacterium sp.]|nr:hypothetical protein [Fretibacterium sp.]
MRKRCSLSLSLALLLFLLPTLPVLAAPSKDVPPSPLTLVAHPPAPKPGDNVLVEAHLASFDHELQGIRWTWDGDGEGFRLQERQSLAYEARTKPLTLTAVLWDRHSGKELERASLTVTPISFDVTLHLLSAPLTFLHSWDVQAQSPTQVQGLAVNTPLLLEGSISPSPQTPDYLWEAQGGTFLVSQDQNQCVVLREIPGEVLVTFSVIGPGGTLGTASLSFDVVFSEEDLRRSRFLEEGWTLRQEALALREKKETTSALAKMERSRRSLTEAGVDDAFLLKELELFKTDQAELLRAKETGALAASLWRDGKLREALEKYREVAQSHPEPSLSHSISQLEALLKKEEGQREKALALTSQARELAEQGKLEASLQAYDKTLKLLENPDVRSERANVEGRLSAIQQKQSLARARRTAALSMEAQGDLEGALKKMAEAREIWSLPEAEEDLKRLQELLNEHRSRQNKASGLQQEAFILEIKGCEGERDPNLLSQALEKYTQALALWPDEETNHSLRRVKSLLNETEERISQADLLSREGDLLAQEGQLQDAKNHYLRAQELRKSKEREEKLSALSKQIQENEQKREVAQGALKRALELEWEGRLDDALETARSGSSAYSLDELIILIKRLESTIAERNRKITRSEELANTAQEAIKAGEHEKALDLLWESHAVWPTPTVSQDIQQLEGRLNEKRDIKQRAEALYNEALALSHASRLEEAWEKLQASLGLHASPEAQSFSEKLSQDLSIKMANEALLAVPLRLYAVPRLPRVGEPSFFRIEEGVWTVDKDLLFHWKATENALLGEAVEGGKGYRFYPADSTPVSVVLTVLRKTSDPDTPQELTSKTFSVTPEPWNLRLMQKPNQSSPQSWDENLKYLRTVNDEVMTRTDTAFQVELVPMPDFPLTCHWEADPDTAIVSADATSVLVRRVKTGTGRVSVTVKNEQGILLGTAQTRLLVAFEKDDVLRDLRRSEAWTLWQAAQRRWEEGEHKEALDLAERSLTLDPSAPEIESGLLQMKVEIEKRNRASRLLAESSTLLLAGDVATAREKAEAASALQDTEAAGELLEAIAKAEHKVEEDRLESSRLRSEAQVHLLAGNRERALALMRNSYILAPDKLLSQDIATLIQELDEAEQTRKKLLSLREKGNEMAEQQNFSDAIRLYEESLQLGEDKVLRGYLDILREKQAEAEVARAHAEELKQQGDALMKEKKVAEALELYKKSLSFWQNEKLVEYIQKQETALAQAEAAKLRKEAEALVKKKNIEGAFDKYRQSLALAHDKTAENFVKKNEAAVMKKRAEALVLEGDKLVKQKKPDEALSSYRAALQLLPSDKALGEKVKTLEAALTPASDDLDSAPPDTEAAVAAEPYVFGEENPNAQSQADLLVREGNNLFKQKQYEEALEKYEASYALTKDEKLRSFITQLKNALRGTELVQEGNALYKAKRYKEALEKYQESLLYHQSPEVEKFIDRLKRL